MQNLEQFLVELKAINADKLPGVLIVYGNTLYEEYNTVRKDQFSLVLIDRFRARAEERTMSVFRATETLLELFPPDGRQLNGTDVYPVDCQIASPDPGLAALALGITVSQGAGE